MINFFKNKSKFSYFLIILILILISISFVKPQNIRNFIKMTIPGKVQTKIKEVVMGKKAIDNLKFYNQINYNDKKIPVIQFEILEIDKLDIKKLIKENAVNPYSNKTNSTFFIEDYKDKIMMIDFTGQILLINNFNLDDIKIFNHNLEKNIKIAGTYIDNDVIYVSAHHIISFDGSTNVCKNIQVHKSIIDNTNFLNFETIFNENECAKNILAGELTLDKKENKLYLTTGSLCFNNSSCNQEKNPAQDEESIYGKIIQIDLKDNDYKIYSKGHRNPLGLIITNDNFLISTEHGPYGGDEINKIVENENYGWPISSYGDADELLEDPDNHDYFYRKNHYDLGFVEPIFAFVPSIGISRLIQIPDQFSQKMKGQFFITSLNRRSLFRVKFDKEYNKIIFKEEIRIGGRIRDITYLKGDNSFILALEDVKILMKIKSRF